MQLKGLRVSRLAGGVYEVVPLYYSKRGGTRVMSHLREKGEDRGALVLKVVGALLARGDLVE